MSGLKCVALIYLCVCSYGIVSANPSVTARESAIVDHLSDYIPEADHGILTVSHDSHYCKIQSLNGHICNYSSTDQTVLVDSTIRSKVASNFMETEIHNAKRLLISPVCLPWIQVFGAEYVRTIASKEQTNCRTWLRLYNSTAANVDYGVRDLSILNSTVERLYLQDQRDIMCYNSTIDHLEFLKWQGYYGYFDRCNINKVSSIEIEDNFKVENSHFGSFESNSLKFLGNEFKLSNTEITHWGTLGWSLQNGRIFLENVTVHDAEPYAIRVDSTVDLLLCRNVTFLKALKPLFALPPQANIFLQNVTANGEAVTASSDWITHESWKGNISTITLSEDTPQCSVISNTSLVCQMANQQNRIMLPSKIPFENITISDAQILEIMEIHGKNLTIFNSTVTFYGDVSDNCKLKPSTLNITYTRVNSEIPSAFTDIHINTSDVGKLRVKCAKKVIIERTKISHLSLAGKHTKVRVSSSLVETFADSYLKRKIKFDRVKIHVVDNVTLDHPDEVSEFKRCSFSMLGYKAVVLKQGNLTLNAAIFYADDDAIYLEPGTFIHFTSSNTNFPHNSLFLSAAHRKQIQLVGHPHSRGSPIHIRREEELLDEQHIFQFTEDHVKDYCEFKDTSTHMKLLHVCDFSSIEKTVLVKLNSQQRWEFKDASHIIVRPFCASEIIISNATNGTITLEHLHCEIKLKITNSSLTKVVHTLGDLTVGNSSIKHLHVQNHGWVEIVNSSIDILNVMAEDLFLLSSRVIEMAYVHVSGALQVEKCSLKRLTEMHFVATARVVISSSHIASMANNSLDLEGATIMQVLNTTFQTIPPKPFSSYGRLILEDVVFANASLSAFEQFRMRILGCNNVLVTGTNFHCDTLEEPLSLNTPSTVPIPSTHNDTSGTKIDGAPTLGPIPSDPLEETTILTHWNVTQYPPIPDSRDTSHSGYGLAAAVIGFFMGIAVSIFAICIMMGTKPSRVTVLKFLRWNQDEGIELLAS